MMINAATRGWLVVMALVIACAPAWADDKPTSIALKSGNTNLTFEATRDKLALKSISDSSGSGWLTGPANGLIWRAALSGPGGAISEIESSTCEYTGNSTHPDGRTFFWITPLSGSAFLAVMNVRCEPTKSLTHWSIRFEMPDGWQITRLDFPIIPGIRISDGLKMAVPHSCGRETNVTKNTTYEGTYPSMHATMQFLALYEGGHGLYLATHDEHANHKTFSVKAGDDGATYQCTTWPARQEKPTRMYELPFQATIGLFDGGYYQAAQVYREFALKTKWGANPVSKRSIPQWLKDIDLWLSPLSIPGIKSIQSTKVDDYFQTSIALHWHMIPFDTLYPDYFPAKDSFNDGKKASLRRIPCINGGFCDPNSNAWKNESADKWAVRKENGELYSETNGAASSLNTMCPYTSYWQDKITSISDRLVNECGVDGVFIDQIGSAPAMECFASGHGHPPGGGTFWVDGYRKLIERVRAKLPADSILATDENAECYLDLMDALLIVDDSSNPAEMIPLFPAVYSDRALTFAYKNITADDLKRSLPFRVKMARAFLWGSQFGCGYITADDIMAPEAKKEAAFLRNLAHCRRSAHDIIISGRFLGMLDVGGDNPKLSGKGSITYLNGTYNINEPSVAASVWLAEDGSLGILMANISDKPRDVEIRLPLESAGIGESDSFTIETIGPEGKRATTKTSKAKQDIRILAAEGILLRVNKSRN